jgi:HSP20 family protein
MLMIPRSGFAPLGQLRREMDRLLGDYFTDGSANQNVRQDVFPSLNIWDEGETLIVQAELPGLTMNDIEVLTVRNELTIRGARKDRLGDKISYHRRERNEGQFARTLKLPMEIDTTKVEATLMDGLLTIKLPKAEQAKARRIEIKTI